MEQQDFTYDIALSFANEDLAIAQAIAGELDRLEVSNYLFTQEDNLALNIKAETWRVYHDESRFAVILISKDYVLKKWATEEREVIQTVNDSIRNAYLIPIRIDNTPVPGLTDHIIYAPWKTNPSYIAISLWRHIQKHTLNNPTVEDDTSKSELDASSGHGDKTAIKITDAKLDQSPSINADGDVTINYK